MKYGTISSFIVYLDQKSNFRSKYKELTRKIYHRHFFNSTTDHVYQTKTPSIIKVFGYLFLMKTTFWGPIVTFFKKLLLFKNLTKWSVFISKTDDSKTNSSLLDLFHSLEQNVNFFK